MKIGQVLGLTPIRKHSKLQPGLYLVTVGFDGRTAVLPITQKEAQGVIFKVSEASKL